MYLPSHINYTEYKLRRHYLNPHNMTTIQINFAHKIRPSEIYQTLKNTKQEPQLPAPENLSITDNAIQQKTPSPELSWQTTPSTKNPPTPPRHTIKNPPGTSSSHPREKPERKTKKPPARKAPPPGKRQDDVLCSNSA